MEDLRLTHSILILLLSTLVESKHPTQAGELINNRKVKCAVPPLPKDVTYTAYHDVTTLRYACRGGYLVGDMTSHCVDGQWTSQPPVCISRGCRRIYHVANGRVVWGYGGALVTVTCAQGYQLVGQPVIACDGRKWNGTLPKCSDGRGRTEVAFSHDSASFPDGVATGRLKTHDDWLAEADYSCIRSSSSIRPPDVTHALATTQWSMVQGKPRLYALYRCKLGYVARGTTKHMYCDKSKWVGGLPKCAPAEKRTPSRGQRPRDQPDLERMTHADLLGMSDDTCRTNGLPTLLVPHNGWFIVRHEMIEGMPRVYAQLTCNEGYHVTAGHRMYCTGNTWFGEDPMCVSDV